MARKRYTTLANTLAQILGRKSWQHGLREAEVILHWPEIVGEKISTHAKPMKLYKDKLYIECDHDVWRTELQFLKPEILKKIAEIEGEGVVREIFLK